MVIIDFVFEQRQPKLGRVSFCTEACSDAAKQSVFGRVLLSFAEVGKKQTRFVECIHLATCLCDMSHFIFKQEQP